MDKLLEQMSRKSGLAPESLIHTGEKTQPVKFSIFNYDSENYKETTATQVEETFAYKDQPGVSWINVSGINQPEIIEKIALHFGIHPLIIEDILHTSQRPKLDDMENYLFLVLRMLDYQEEKAEIYSEQVSLVLGNNYVISFQENGGDVFEPIRERIRSNKGKIRKMGSDYLLYALLDAIVDHYFIILEKLGDKIEDLEEELLKTPGAKALHKIHQIKHEIFFIRRAVYPLREIINGLAKSESSLISKGTELYLRDVYDHTIQVIETIENFRDLISGMMDIYLSSVSNRLNEVMKVLTMIATIFIPLTFIVGLYGMNFNTQASPWNMPELNWKYGYPAVVILMLGVAVGMLLYFRKKKWL